MPFDALPDSPLARLAEAGHGAGQAAPLPRFAASEVARLTIANKQKHGQADHDEGGPVGGGEGFQHPQQLASGRLRAAGLLPVNPSAPVRP
jgi:hypothetical protein